jgi:S1-C subfamily serine protease
MISMSRSVGSAFYIGDNKFLTSAHCVVTDEGIPERLIFLKGHPMKVLKFNTDTDLAIIECPTLKDIDEIGDMKPFQLGLTPPKMGDKVLSIGTHLGWIETVSPGHVTAIDGHRIVTNASVNPGCSGGPLLDSNFRVIGLNEAILTPSRSAPAFAGVSFHVSITEIRSLVAALITEGPYVDPLAIILNE